MLIHDIPAVIEWVTAFMTLLPGDVILTGTPAGVGPLCGQTVSVDGRRRRHPHQPRRGTAMSQPPNRSSLPSAPAAGPHRPVAHG